MQKKGMGRHTTVDNKWKAYNMLVLSSSKYLK
jgi:hypothetical protein